MEKLKKPTVIVGLVLLLVIATVVGVLVYNHKKKHSVRYFLEKDMQVFMEAFKQTEKHFDDYEEYTRAVDDLHALGDEIRYRIFPQLVSKFADGEATELTLKVNHALAAARATQLIWEIKRERSPSYTLDAELMEYARTVYDRAKTELDEQVQILKDKYCK